MRELFRGLGVAMITPFKDGEVDFSALAGLIEYQIGGGVDCLLTLGTTGEPSTMTRDEKRAVIEFVIEKVNGRVPVLVGTGGNNTTTAIEDSIFAEKAGASGLLIVTPYYNKCTQNGLVEHYFAIADSVNIPIIVYNVPGRTGLNITPSTFSKLIKHRNINAIKEASGNMDQIMQIAAICSKSGAVLYSGDDGLTLPVMAVGGSGVISVSANVVPALCKELVSLCLAGDFAASRAVHEKLLPLSKAIFVEVNPIPVKKCAELMGLCSGDLRLPLTSLEPANLQPLVAALEAAGVTVNT